jgi:isochorismate synthase
VAPSEGGGRFRRVRRWADAASARLVGAGPDAPGGVGRRARFHGAFAFDPRPGAGGRPRGARPAAWSGLPSTVFHLPTVELRGGDGRTELAVTVEQEAGEVAASAPSTARRALDRVRDRLARAPAGRRGVGGPGGAGVAGEPGVRSVRERPGPGRWAEIVEAALEEIRSGRLEKVVPARLVEVGLADAPDPVELARRLRAGNPGAIPYLVEPAPGRAFVGAAPEIVAALDEGVFHATAVAGTAADSGDPGERDRLARDLLSSRKDRREHEVGVRDMRRALEREAGVARVDREPRVLRLRGVQHLLTNVTADVPPDAHVLDLLRAMHPTAAVNGAPRPAARRFLRREEPFDRGWYAGPVGWFDTAGDGEFAPGLRSALVRRRRVRMFAGAGIVAGSVPGDEWRETGLKLRTVLEALGADADVLGDDRAEAVAAGGRRER